MSALHAELKWLKAAAESRPPLNETARVLDLLLKGEPYDRLFFDSMRDPTWIPILDVYGYYSNLPDSKETSEGRKYYPYHLPLFGLAKVASKAPHAVASIIARLTLPDNPTVAEQVLSCIASIKEPSCFAILHPIFAQISRNQNQNSWIWVQDLLKNWIEVKAYEDVLVVLSSYLGALASATDRTPSGDEWMTKHVDEIALEPLANKFPLEIAGVVFNALVRYVERGKEAKVIASTQNDFLYRLFDGDNYMSSYGIEDFTVQSNYQTFETILAFRLYQVSKCLYEQNNVRNIELLDELLRSHNWNLFDRIRWQLYVNFPEIAFEKAKKDVLDRIPIVGWLEFSHYHEFARLLEAFAIKYGDSFLSLSQSTLFFQNVIDGPRGQGADSLSKEYKDGFRRRQLWPIASLLGGHLKSQFKEMLGDHEVSLRSYQPYRGGSFQGGMIESVVPKEAENFDLYTDAELWKQLNNWPTRPLTVDANNWLKREDYGSFAKAFIDFVQLNPDRFSAQSKWWEKILRPEPLIEALRRANDRLQKRNEKDWKQPVADEWLCWMGVAKRIIECSKINRTEVGPAKNENVHGRTDWYWPRTMVSDFLIAIVQSDLSEAQTHINETSKLLRFLAESEDPRLETASAQRLEDWYATAINSVRGRAFEGLLKLALRQKKIGSVIEPWIFNFLKDRLASLDESPAIFALFGANLRLIVYLFGDILKSCPSMILPDNRPVHEGAAIVSHFCYDHPLTGIVEIFPQILNKALLILQATRSEKEESKTRQSHAKNFALQVGVQICFYSWNNALETHSADSLLDNFFAINTNQTRAALIRQIAWIFENTKRDHETIENEKIFLRVMRLWERRSRQILMEIDGEPSSYTEFENELAAFLDWIACEAFPFEWRFNNAIIVLERLKKLADIHRVLFKLQDWGMHFPDRLKSTLQLLLHIISLPSEHIRWQISVQRFGPLLLQGLESNDSEVQILAEKCRDSLLGLNLFEFLNLENSKQ